MGFQMRLTEQGADLLSKTHGGATLDLIGFQVGSGLWSEEERKGTPPDALKSVERSVAITDVTVLGKGASRVEGLLTNNGLETGFRMTELAITAKHPTLGTVVYMAAYLAPEVANYLEERGRIPVEMPLELDIKTAVGGEVRFIVDDRFVSASKKDVEKKMQEHDAADDAHPKMRVAAPHLSIPDGMVNRVNEGEKLGMTVSGVPENPLWKTEVKFQVVDADGNDVTEQFSPEIVDKSVTITAAQVTGDTDFEARFQTWQHGGLKSLWSNSFEFTVVDVPVDSPTLTFPANHAVNIGETPTIRWTKGASDDPSKKYADAEIIISRDLLRTVVVAQSGKLGAVTEWTVPSDVLNTNEHLYVSVHTKWGDTWSGWVTHDFFTSAQFQFIQAPQIIAPQQNSQVMWSGLKVVIATPVVEQGGTLQQDNIECEYKKGSGAAKTIRVDKGQLFVDLPTLDMNADHSARVRVHDKVRGWSGWSDWRVFRTKNLRNGMRIDGGRVLDMGNYSLLVAPPSTFKYGDMGNDRGDIAFYAQFSFEGVTGYRLPTLPELEKLYEQRKIFDLATGSYRLWSSESGEVKDWFYMAIWDSGKFRTFYWHCGGYFAPVKRI